MLARLSLFAKIGIVALILTGIVMYTFTNSPAVAQISPICGTDTITDVTIFPVRNCIRASTEPEDGMLMPLGDYFFVDPSYNVGIGTKVPTEKLHVEGNIWASGTVSAADPTAPDHLATKSYVDNTLVQHTNTGNSSELVTGLDVHAANWTVVFSQELTDVEAGEVIMAMGEMETTNDLGYLLVVTSRIILGSSASSISGTEITEANGFNITPMPGGMHHGVSVKVGTVASPNSYATRYVNFVAKSASTASNPGDMLTVNQDYGRLSVVRFPQ